MKPRPRPGHWGKRDRSPRTLGDPCPVAMDSGHVGKRPLQICLGRAGSLDQIAGSADMLGLICHLDGSVSVIRPGCRGVKVHFKWRKRQVRLGQGQYAWNTNRDRCEGTDHPLITQRQDERARNGKASRRKTYSACQAREH